MDTPILMENNVKHQICKSIHIKSERDNKESFRSIPFPIKKHDVKDEDAYVNLQVHASAYEYNKPKQSNCFAYLDTIDTGGPIS